MSGEEPKVVAGAEDDLSLLGGKAGQLRDMFAPDSIAVVGASPNPRRIGSRVLANLRRHGFAGRVHVVNPRYPQVDGLRTLSSLSELPEVPDLTLFAVDADTSLELLAELGSLGGRNAVLLASGFESGPDGARRLRRLTELSDRHELRVVGPNSQGLWSVGHRMVLAFGSEAGRERVFAGPVAVVAHSGSLGGAVTRQLLDIGVGVSYFVSTGDGAVLDTADYLRQVIEDPSVRVVALYLEGTRDGRHLRSAVREAARRGIRVVALAGGLTAAGQATTASHTGRMITRPRLLTDLLAQHGVVVTGSMREFVAAVRTLATAPRSLPARPRTAVVGISGGMLALLVDGCAGRVEIATFSDSTVDRLRAVLPPYTDPQNPVDLTGSVVEDESLLVEAVDAALADPGVDALIAGLDNRGYDRVVRNADRFGTSADRSGKPVVFTLWDPPLERAIDVERELGAAGVFVADDPADAVGPLEWLTDLPLGPEPVASEGIQLADLRSWAGIEGLAAALGGRVPATRVLHSGEPVPGAELKSPPYVVKPLPNAVRHKTDRGLVHLNLYEPDDVAEAVALVRGAVGPEIPVLVQEMVSGVELLITVRLDTDWGPVLTVGAGGALVELLDDIAHVSLPCSEAEIAEAVARLDVDRLLRGFRGAPPADREAAVKAASLLSRITLSQGDAIEEIELNPLVVGTAGEGVYVVDVLVTQPESVGPR